MMKTSIQQKPFMNRQYSSGLKPSRILPKKAKRKNITSDDTLNWINFLIIERGYASIGGRRIC